MNPFLTTLFNEGESVCFGHNAYDTATSVVADSSAVYVTMNPVLGHRCNANVTSFRNITIEMDKSTIDEQRSLLDRYKVPFSTLVFSGKKSLHAIISLRDPCHNAEYYNSLVKIAYKILDPKKEGIIDHSMKTPSKFTRNAGAMRDGVEQALLEVRPRISQDDFFNWAGTHLSIQELARQLDNRKREYVKTEPGFVRPPGHNTTKFISGETDKPCRHDAAKDAVVELLYCGRSGDEIIQMLSHGFYSIKPDAQPGELDALVNWAVNNIKC